MTNSNTSMGIFVISLPEARERRESVRFQLKKAGVAFKFFDAFSGPGGWQSFLGYDRCSYRLNTGRDAVAAEAGCYASHLALWHRCVAFNRPIVILEDDFQSQPGLRKAILLLQDSIEQYGFVRLDPCPANFIVQPNSHGKLSIGYCRRYPHGSKGYAISPRVARAFIACSSFLRAPVDKFIKMFWLHGQPLHALQPPAIGHHALADRSAIEPFRGTNSASLLLRSRRFFQKGIWALQRLRFNALMLDGSRSVRVGRTPAIIIQSIPASAFSRQDESILRQSVKLSTTHL